MIKFNLNGENTLLDRAPDERLLDVLREEYNLMGVKEGCGEGECGACSVIIDGSLRNACLVAIGSLQNKKVTTIEGYSKTDRYKILEKTFAEAGAVQCGFCTPGMVLAAEVLLKKCPKPNESQIREAISGNICRCTGYNMIVEAIANASVEGVGLW